MKFLLDSLERTVDLSDELIDKCTKYEEISESLFVVPIIAKYPKYDKNNVSDEELSNYCNELLISELELLRDIPNIISCVENNKEILKEKKWVEIVV